MFLPNLTVSGILFNPKPYNILPYIAFLLMAEASNGCKPDDGEFKTS
jgi:hypothetical protein